MLITVEQAGIQTIEAEAIIVNLFEGVTHPGGATGVVDKALGGAIQEVIACGDLSGKLGEAVILYSRGAIPAPRVIVVGLGPQALFDLEAVREASAVAIQKAHAKGITSVATIVHGGGIGGLEITQATQAVVEGTMLALYQYDAPRAKQNDDLKPIEQLMLVEFDDSKIDNLQIGAQIGQIIAESVYLARDLVNEPSNTMTPTALANVTKAMCQEVGLTYRVLEEAEMHAQGMGALLAVSKGASEPSKLITIEHRPQVALTSKPSPIILIGKGVTYDTGGYTLKQSASMLTMKADMGGGAAIIGAMRAIALLKLPIHVVGLVPAVENVVSASAYRPGDVFIAKNKVSIEIISTDCEGRMLLADTLCYADTLRPRLVIDVATLTGGKVTGLGNRYNALFCDDEALENQLLSIGNMVSEPLWCLPLDPAYDRQIKSRVADIKNRGGRHGNAITAARFLTYFVGNWPWAHIDMAGSAMYGNHPEDTPRSYLTEGATGIPVRTLVEFLRQQKTN